MQLFIIPHAGGSSYGYLTFQKAFNKEIDVEILDLPGRGKSITTPPSGNIDYIVQFLLAKIRDKVKSNFCIWGHSMGATLAYLITIKIKEERTRMPLKLFVSGKNAPSCPSDKIRHTLSSADLWKEMKALGGTPDEILNDSSFINFMEPIIRADFEALEKYVYSPTNPLDIPITIMMGSEDRFSEGEILLWQKESSLPIDIKMMTGGHFFIFDKPQKIVDLIISEIYKPN